MNRTLRAVTVAVAATAALCVAEMPAVAVGPSVDSDVTAWQRSGRPERLVIIRPGFVELLNQGAVVRRLYPPAGAVPISWLAASAGQKWVAHAPGEITNVTLRTAVLLTPGTTLKIGAATKKVLFATGGTAASGTWIRGSRATLSITGAVLASVGPDGREAAAPSAAGRPYIHMGAGGRLIIADSTVSGFGLPGAGDQGFSGVTWGKGSSGSAVNSSFLGNGTGLRLAGSTGVRLLKVTVMEATDDGVVLNGDTGTVIQGLTSQGNGRNGLTLGGTGHRTLSGISTQDNHGSGVKATAQTGLKLIGVTSHGDKGGGITLMSCAGCTVERAIVAGTPVALAISGADSQVALMDPQLSDGTTGISLAAGIKGASVSGGTIRVFDRAIAISGSAVTVQGTAVSDSRTGISVYGHAGHVALRGVTVTGGRVGVTASGSTSAVSLTGVRIGGTSRKGLESVSPGLRVTGGSISGSTTALDLGASARLDTLTVSGARRGVHLAVGVHATATDLDVTAARKGIEVERNARLDLTDSRVRAPSALVGRGTIRRHGRVDATLPPFPTLGFAALLAVILAAGLQIIHKARHRKAPRSQVAPHVRNIA